MKKSNQAKLSKRKQKEISKCMKHLMPNSTIVMGNIKPSERDTPFERVGKWPLWNMISILVEDYVSLRVMLNIIK